MAADDLRELFEVEADHVFNQVLPIVRTEGASDGQRLLLTTAERHAREEGKPERLQAMLARSCVVALLLMA